MSAPYFSLFLMQYLARRHDFPERSHHELTLVHTGMWQGELRCAEMEVVVEQDVYIDDSVVIDASHTLLRAPHSFFYVCRALQHLLRCEIGDATHCRIDKGIFRIEPPWFGDVERRAA